LFADEKECVATANKNILKKLFELKASGSQEEYIYNLQRSAALKK